MKNKLTTVEEKSLALAELMGYGWSLNPYDSTYGLAQFAAILLKFKEVFNNFFMVTTDSCGEEIKPHFVRAHGYSWIGDVEYFEDKTATPTQANILDEILRMNGYDVE